MVHGIVPGAAASSKLAAVHLRGAAHAGINKKTLAVLKGEIEVTGGYAGGRKGHVAGAEAAKGALSREGQGCSGRQFVGAIEDDQFADHARVRQLLQSAVLCFSILPKPPKRSPDDQHAQKRKPIPCCQGNHFINIAAQGKLLSCGECECEGGGFSEEKPPPSRSLPKRRWGWGDSGGRGCFSERSISPPRPLSPEERLAFEGGLSSYNMRL